MNTSAKQTKTDLIKDINTKSNTIISLLFDGAILEDHSRYPIYLRLEEMLQIYITIKEIRGEDSPIFKMLDSAIKKNIKDIRDDWNLRQDIDRKMRTHP